MTVGILPGLVVLALLIKTAHEPLPTRQDTPFSTNVASIIPLLSASGVSESANFHRLHELQDIAASEEVQFRHSTHLHQALPVVTAAAVAEPPLDYDFDTPRTGWMELDQKDRAALDALLSTSAKDASVELLLHGTRETDASSRLLGRYLSEVRNAAPGSCDVLVSDKSIEILPSATAEGPLDIVFTGDFQTSPPTKKQLAALDEILDYLSIKTGQIHILQHLQDNGPLHHPCLGRHFPVRQIAAAVASPLD